MVETFGAMEWFEILFEDLLFFYFLLQFTKNLNCILPHVFLVGFLNKILTHHGAAVFQGLL